MSMLVGRALRLSSHFSPNLGKDKISHSRFPRNIKVKRRLPDRSTEPYLLTNGEQTRHPKVLFDHHFITLMNKRSYLGDDFVLPPFISIFKSLKLVHFWSINVHNVQHKVQHNLAKQLSQQLFNSISTNDLEQKIIWRCLFYVGAVSLNKYFWANWMKTQY